MKQGKSQNEKIKQRTKKRRSFITTFLIPFVAISVIAVVVVLLSNNGERNNLEIPDIIYDEVQEGDDETQANFVKFDAYFLKEGEDGFAKKVRGTVASVTENVELYMDLKVLNNGYLKDAAITLEDTNYYVSSGIMEDNEISSFKNNVITLKEIQNGTAKNIQAILSYNTYTDLSKVSKIILSGIYVDYEGNETEIYKEIDATVDFYTDVGLKWNSFPDRNYNKIIEATVNKDEKEVYIFLSFIPEFTPAIHPPEKELILEGTLPKFNGYDPIPESIKVYVNPERKIENLKEFTYDEETRKITIDGAAWIELNYPYEAYESLGGTDVTLDFKFSAVGTVYGNPKIQPELTTNTINKTLSIKASAFDEKGISIECDVYTYKSKKQNAYMFYNNEYKDAYFDIEYEIEYNYMPESLEKIIVKEDYTNSPDSKNSYYKNNGVSLRSSDGTYYDVNDIKEYISMFIWHSGSSNSNISSEELAEIRKDKEKAKEYDKRERVNGFIGFFGENGWIKIYDDKTGELIDTLDITNDFGMKEPYNYSESTTTDSEGNTTITYRFYYGKVILSKPINNIRIEMSRPVEEDGIISFMALANLDSKKMTEKFTIEQFDKLDRMFASANLYAKYNNTDEEISLRGSVGSEEYETYNTVLGASLYQGQEGGNWWNVPKFYSGKLTENVTLKLSEGGESCEDWKNGIILVEFPIELIDIDINSIVQQNSWYDYKEDEHIYEEEKELKTYQKFIKDGKTYLKIYTDEELIGKNKVITVNFDAVASTFSVTSTKYVNIYYYNEIATGYSDPVTEDIYDINDNGDIVEKIGNTTTKFTITASTGLITATQGSHFNTRGDIIVSPQVGTVFKHDTGRTAQVDVIMQNSYNNSIQDVLLLGKFPYEGNKSPITDTALGSTYTANVLGEITVPDNLKDTVTVYYSTNENTNKDLTDTSNGWVTGDKVTDWSKVRTYLIDFGTTVMGVGDSYTFSYNISFPDGLDYDEVTYATHGIYFNLNTSAGLLEMNTEPSKVGFRVGPEYTFELDTQIFEKGTDKVIPNAKVKVKGPGMGEGKEYTTDDNGYVYIQGLYADEEYTIEEVEVPERYVLDTDVIRFRVNSPANVENKDPFTIDLLENSFRNAPVVTQDSFGNIRIHTELENETQAGKVIVKYVDREGNELATTDIMNGIVGEEYKTARKAIEGYMAYGEDPANKEGVYKVEDQTVIYVYDRITTKVIVKYVDRNGYELLPEDTIDGKVGDDYKTERKPVEGYKAYGEEPYNKEGKMTEEVIEVIYVYDKVPAKVIVKYVDEEGNELLPEDIIDGKAGDEYTTERKPVEGYVASGNDPENKNGKMIEGVIEVVYVYKKIPVNTSDIDIVKYVVISLIAIVGVVVGISVIKRSKKSTK